MPKLHAYTTRRGMYIVANRGGFTTYQITSAGLAYLLQLGCRDGTEISHQMLDELLGKRMVYTGGSGPGEAPDTPRSSVPQFNFPTSRSQTPPPPLDIKPYPEVPAASSVPTPTPATIPSSQQVPAKHRMLLGDRCRFCGAVKLSSNTIACRHDLNILSNHHDSKSDILPTESARTARPDSTATSRTKALSHEAAPKNSNILLWLIAGTTGDIPHWLWLMIVISLCVMARLFLSMYFR